MTDQEIDNQQLPSVAVVVVSFNTSALTARCVESVLASTGVHCQVYVVDNASTDRTLSQLRKKFSLTDAASELSVMKKYALRPGNKERFPLVDKDWNTISNCWSAVSGGHELYLLSSNTNLGFGRANNLATAASSADYVLFLNTDAFVSADTISLLIKPFGSNGTEPATAVLWRSRKKLDNVGIVGAQLINHDGTLQRQGGALPTQTNIFRWIFFLDDIPGINQVLGSYQHHDSDMKLVQRSGIRKVGWVGGTAMMISRACLEEIGGFDPQIFMYGEDTELCWRATQKHWDVALVVAGKVEHLGMASGSSKNAMLGELAGIVYLWKKYHSALEQRFLHLTLTLGLYVRILLFGILRQYGRQRIYREALALV